MHKMMKRLGLLVVTMGLMAVATRKAEAGIQTVVTFDDLNGSGVLANGYGGINWGGTWTYYDNPQFPYTSHSGSERIYNAPPVYVPDDSFSFTTAVQFNGAWIAGASPATIQFQLYLGGALVGSSSSLVTSATPAFLGSGYSGLVDKVVVHDTNSPFGADGYVLDDVTYTSSVSAVPEPATLISCATAGLLGLGYALCRRKAKVAP